MLRLFFLFVILVMVACKPFETRTLENGYTKVPLDENFFNKNFEL